MVLVLDCRHADIIPTKNEISNWLNGINLNNPPENWSEWIDLAIEMSLKQSDLRAIKDENRIVAVLQGREVLCHPDLHPSRQSGFTPHQMDLVYQIDALVRGLQG